MATRGSSTRLVIPEGSDRAILRRLNARATTQLGALAAAEHREIERNANLQQKGLVPLLNAMDIDRPAVEKAAATVRAANRRRFSAERPGRFEPLKGPNPTRYAPFDFTWSWISGGGLNITRQYGPNARTGETGYSIGIFNGGSLSTQSAVGFWYYATANGTLRVVANATVWGRAYIFSGLFGYASAYAGLRVWVQPYSPFQTYRATTPIYDNSGVLEFDIRYFDYVNRTVSISVPARRNTWYAIWGGAVQSAGAGGVADAVSNFQMHVGPIHYWVD